MVCWNLIIAVRWPAVVPVTVKTQRRMGAILLWRILRSSAVAHYPDQVLIASIDRPSHFAGDMNAACQIHRKPNAIFDVEDRLAGFSLASPVAQSTTDRAISLPEARSDVARFRAPGQPKYGIDNMRAEVHQDAAPCKRLLREPSAITWDPRPAGHSDVDKLKAS